MITTIEVPTEQQKKDMLNHIIYLGIPTNILCIDDRLEPKYIKSENDTINDFTATLYLGKIIFKKNKYGNLAPIYIPSQITESAFENLNTFWLNEINPNPKMPFKSIIQCETIYIGKICEGSSESIPHQKIYYYRTPKNIVLSKNQIISYFTELHKLNASFIKNYIDSINKNNGIRANYLHDKIYDELLDKNLLQKDMFKWYSNAPKAASFKAKLIALDYLKKMNQYNFNIALFNELFYAYLAWSLKEYLLDDFIFIKDLLFNNKAYKKEIKSKIEQENKDAKNIKLNYKFDSPNRIYRTYPATGKFIYNDDKPPVYAPSPLGNYYFELSDNKNTFIEFFQKIYPKNPPKYWNKEMMNKLELKLE